MTMEHQVVFLFALVASISALGDLEVEQDINALNPRITTESFMPEDCAVQEGCVVPGTRKLLRFTATWHNKGPDAIEIGDPESNPQFVYSECHDHFHFKQLIHAHLEDSKGNHYGNYTKIGFCVLDYKPYIFPPPSPARYTCGYQGIQAGFSDSYQYSLDCQWIDVTDIPPGNYTLKVSVNNDRIFREVNYANNEASYPVTITPEPTPPFPLPHNAKCSSAEEIKIGSYALGTNEGAQPGFYYCRDVETSPVDGKLIWYKVIGNGRRLKVSTCHPETWYDTKVMVYKSCGGCDQLRCMAAADDTDCGVLSHTTWCSEEGVTYYILLAGYDEVEGRTETGKHKISIEDVGPCVPSFADDCSAPMRQYDDDYDDIDPYSY